MARSTAAWLQEGNKKNCPSGVIIAPDGKSFYARPPAQTYGEKIGVPLPPDNVLKAANSSKSEAANSSKSEAAEVQRCSSEPVGKAHHFKLLNKLKYINTDVKLIEIHFNMGKMSIKKLKILHPEATAGDKRLIELLDKSVQPKRFEARQRPRPRSLLYIYYESQLCWARVT